MDPAFTLSELEDWELNGATWRAITLDQRRAVLDLCSCSGERMDRVESTDPALIEYVCEHSQP